MEPDLNAEIGRAVQQLRTAAGMSQGELAEQLSELGENFHQQTILKIEKGTRALKFTEAVKIARVFQVSVDSLIYSQDRLEESLETRRRFDAVMEGLAELERKTESVQYSRIELADWAAKEDRAADDLQAARGILSMDPAAIVRNAGNEVLRAVFAELPGVENTEKNRSLELLRWDPTGDDAEA